MKFTKKFETTSEYNEARSSLILPNVSLVANPRTVYYHAKPTNKVGDYLYNDGTVGSTANANVVGVCVIPNGLLADKKARFMSIKGITTGSTAGGNDESIIWSSNTSKTVLSKQYTQVACVGINEGEGGEITDEVEHAASYAYLPSDSTNGNFTALTNPYDSSVKYAYDDEDHHIASPYYTNGVFNANYSALTTTGGTTINNALSDFSGYENTQILIDDADVVAAKHCALFNPGYGDGKWYLPAIGELAFVMPRFNEIKTAIQGASAAGGVALGEDNLYWSSTEYGSNGAWRVYTDDGYVGNYTKGYDNYVRAFLAL